MTRRKSFTPSDAQTLLKYWRMYRALTRPGALGPYVKRRARATLANRLANRGR